MEKTVLAIKETVAGLDPGCVEGISFSGQMHGLVLLDEDHQVLRNAILWNDTRTTQQCLDIYELVGEKRLLNIAKNPALEGFILPRLLWVKEHEPETYEKAAVFLLPKDYLRFRLAGEIHTEFSDAAGTLMLNISEKEWSREICEAVGVNLSLCPPLIESSGFARYLMPEIAQETGLSEQVKVFAGGADNACGAIGSGVLEEGKTLCSIGTSGVVLTYEGSNEGDFGGRVHYFNHGKENAYYTMGVTLAAGHSLSWFKNVFAEDEHFDDLVKGLADVPIGAYGLLLPHTYREKEPLMRTQLYAEVLSGWILLIRESIL